MTVVINPGFSPYTFVRTNVMRSKLLKREDYQKLLKMSFAEITKYLQDREYREDISRLGVHETGIELLDQALAENLGRTFEKLRRITNDELLPLVDAYLLRHDIWNVKTILRALYTGADREHVKRMLLVIESGLKEATLHELLNAQSYDRALEMLDKTPLRDAISDEKDLMDVENALDTYYNVHLATIAEGLGKEGKLFQRYLVTEVEINNLLRVIRLKSVGLPGEEIAQYLVRLPVSRLNRLFKELPYAKDIAEVVAKCKRTRYRPNLERGLAEYEKTGSLIAMERELREYLLYVSGLSSLQNLLSVNVILGFMLEKEYEAKNLRTIMKGKALGIDEKQIEEELLVL